MLWQSSRGGDHDEHPITTRAPETIFALLACSASPLLWTHSSALANETCSSSPSPCFITTKLSGGVLPPEMAGLVIVAFVHLPFLLFLRTQRPARGQTSSERNALIRSSMAGDRDHGGGRARLRDALVPARLACVLLMGPALDALRTVKFAYCRSI